MRRHVIPSTILFVLFAAVFYLLLNTPWLIARLGPRYIKQFFKDRITVSFNVGKQTFSFPQTLIFSDIDVVVTRDDAVYRFNARQLTLYDFFTFLKKKQSIQFLVNGAASAHGIFSLDGLNIKGVIYFQGPYFSRIEGIFAAAVVNLKPHVLKNVQGQIRGLRNKIQLQEVSANNGYGGKLKGQMTLEFKNDGNYACWFELSDLDPQLLARANPGLFAQMKGALIGALRVVWDNRQITLLALNLQFDKGGVLGRDLVKKICSYDSNPETKRALLSLLNPDGSLSVGAARLRVQNTGPYRLDLNYVIEEDLDRLRLKESREVYIKGGLNGVLFPEINPLPEGAASPAPAPGR